MSIIQDNNYSKMYIAVLDEVPDHMVPTLVAHSILNAHMFFLNGDAGDEAFLTYTEWLTLSFRKVVLRVNRKEFTKIQDTLIHWGGYENTTLGGEISCLVVLPVSSVKVPNVLRYAQMWKPRETANG